MAGRRIEDHWGTPGGDGSDPEAVNDGVEILRAPSGAHYFRPRSITKLTGDAADVIAEVQAAALQREKIGRRLEELVNEARECGASWDAIGWSVGTTGQAARQRWGT